MLYKFVDKTLVKPQNKNIVAGDVRIANPTEEQLKELGYKELVEEERPSIYYDYEYQDGDVITKVWVQWDKERLEAEYPKLVSSKVRQRYGIDDEIALLRQKDSKIEEFEEYNAHVEQCKAEAREELGL